MNRFNSLDLPIKQRYGGTKHSQRDEERAHHVCMFVPEFLDDTLRGVLPLEAREGRLLRHHPKELHQPPSVGLERQKPARERHHEVHESLTPRVGHVWVV